VVRNPVTDKRKSFLTKIIMETAFDPLKALLSIGTERWKLRTAIDPNALRFAVLSYAGCGEDLSLRNIFKRKLIEGERGTFVDIGCMRPVLGSNTYALYSYGWRGLCVDARDYSTEYSKFRPEDKFVQGAVGFSGEMYWYKHLTNTGMSRVRSTNDFNDPAFDPQPEIVKGVSLEELIRTHLPDKTIDLLSLDVEGTELQVMQSNNWDIYRPNVVIMECHDFLFDGPPAPTVKFLMERDYTLYQFVGPNVIMIAREAIPK